MSYSHLAITVLFDGSLERLGACLKSIGSQVMPANTKVSLLVAHRSDEISVAQLQPHLDNTNIKVQLVEIDDPHNDRLIYRNQSIAALTASIPQDADWVWLFDETARLYSKTSLITVDETIMRSNDADFDFIHLCRASRSNDTGQLEVSNAVKLCEDHGYHEIFGNMASMALKTEVLKNAFGHYFQEHVSLAVTTDTDLTEFTHTKFLYLALCEGKAALLDRKIVETQLSKFDEAAGDTLDMTSFTLIQDLINLGEAITFKPRWSPKFFRCNESSLWTETLKQQVIVLNGLDETSNAFDQVAVGFIDNWQEIWQLVDFIKCEQTQDLLRNLVKDALGKTLDCLRDERRDKSLLHEFLRIEIENQDIYPTTTINLDAGDAAVKLTA